MSIADEYSFQVEPNEESDVLEKKEEEAQLLSLLTQLPEKQQEVIQLKFQNGFSYKEIAKITGLSSSNVGYLIHTGIKTMRTAARKVAKNQGEGL